MMRMRYVTTNYASKVADLSPDQLIGLQQHFVEQYTIIAVKFHW